jgi:hypothetical protein
LKKPTFAKKGGGRKEKEIKKLRLCFGEEKRNECRVLSSFLFETLTSEDITTKNSRKLDRINREKIIK